MARKINKYKIHDKKSLEHHNKRLKWQVMVLSLACIITFALMIFFAVRANSHYRELESHKDYFKQPNAPIQDWMTVHTVTRYYNLSETQIYSELNITRDKVSSELGIDDSTVVDKLTIGTICVRKHLDCNAVIDRLSSIRAR